MGVVTLNNVAPEIATGSTLPGSAVLKAKLVPVALAALLQPAKAPEKVPMVASFAMFLTLRSVRPDCVVAPLLKFL